MAQRIVVDLNVVDPTALDTRALDAVRSNLGQQQTDALLGLFVEELSERFEPTSDVDQLAHDAHVTISAAGVLGFVVFSDLCRAVEVACRSGQDLSALRERLALARDGTLCQIEVLRSTS